MALGVEHRLDCIDLRAIERLFSRAATFARQQVRFHLFDCAPVKLIRTSLADNTQIGSVLRLDLSQVPDEAAEVIVFVSYGYGELLAFVHRIPFHAIPLFSPGERSRRRVRVPVFAPSG